MTDILTCPVCYEPFSESKEQSLNPCCQIPVCESCMREWVGLLCRTGMSPTCPGCRSKLQDSLVAQWTANDGAEFDQQQHPAAMSLVDPTSSTSTTEEEEAIDEFTRVWMNDNGIMRCNNCGAHIEKIEGCGAVMCLCGFRLCWNCKVPERDCHCGVCEDRGDFHDNVWGSHVEDFCSIEGYGVSDDDSDDDSTDASRISYRCPRVATIDGSFDLKSYLEERRNLAEAKGVL